MAGHTRAKPRRVPTDGRYIRYSLQWKTCGKRNCVCHTDKSKRHGPYWHAYWVDDQGRHVGCHVGAELPPGVEVTRKRGKVSGLTAQIVQASAATVLFIGGAAWAVSQLSDYVTGLAS